MCGGGGDADRIEPVDRRGATDRTGHVRGACFELVRHLVPGAAVESDRADHVAAAHFRPARLYRLARSKAYLFRGVEIRWKCAPELIGDDTPASEIGRAHV